MPPPLPSNLRPLRPSPRFPFFAVVTNSARPALSAHVDAGPTELQLVLSLVVLNHGMEAFSHLSPLEPQHEEAPDHDHQTQPVRPRARLLTPLLLLPTNTSYMLSIRAHRRLGAAVSAFIRARRSRSNRSTRSLLFDRITEAFGVRVQHDDGQHQHQQPHKHLNSPPSEEQQLTPLSPIGPKSESSSESSLPSEATHCGFTITASPPWIPTSERTTSRSCTKSSLTASACSRSARLSLIRAADANRVSWSTKVTANPPWLMTERNAYEIA